MATHTNYQALVTVLQETLEPQLNGSHPVFKVMREMADEIDRLRAEVERLESEGK